MKLHVGISCTCMMMWYIRSGNIATWHEVRFPVGDGDTSFYHVGADQLTYLVTAMEGHSRHLHIPLYVAHTARLRINQYFLNEMTNQEPHIPTN